MHASKTSAVKRTDCIHLYKNTSLPYAIWSNEQGAAAIQTIIFLGTVQIGKLAEWVAESCPPNTIVVQGAPHWLAKSDGSDIPEYMFDFTKQVIDDVLKKFPITKVHIIAESQAVPGVVDVFAQERYGVYLKKMTLIQPLGLNNHVFQGTAGQRIKTFKRRVAANFAYQLTALVLDKKLRYNHRLLNGVVGIGLRNPRARAQYGSGLSYDAIPGLRLLYARNRNIRIVCGANDKLFPPGEISAALSRNGLPLEVMLVRGVPHSPLATRFGRRLLVAALSE
jgi:hypothetical protein